MKWWHPIPQVMDAIARAAADTGLVVDVGGNASYRFPPATYTVGWEGDKVVDLSSEPLPFDDGQVGFLFCRHTLEDLADPGHLLAEIARVARAGYVETPSPFAEVTRGVDAWGNHRGYIHHRWVCGNVGGVLTLAAKYPVIERMPLANYWPWLDGPRYWNTHFLWKGHLGYDILQHERGIDLATYDARDVPAQYMEILHNLLVTCQVANDKFWQSMGDA